jgi:hypothetical protein
VRRARSSIRPIRSEHHAEPIALSCDRPHGLVRRSSARVGAAGIARRCSRSRSRSRSAMIRGQRRRS